MKTKKIISKSLVFIICLSLVLGVAVPANAWKINTHVYSANLILNELKENNGYVEIAPFGKFKVIPEYLDAIQSYPEYYRAGAMGPDVFPDIYVGQTVFHPGKVYPSGDFIEKFWDKAKNLPTVFPVLPGLPAYMVEQSTAIMIADKKQAMAFILGFSTHAAGDYFGHSYINNWAGDTWPEISDGLSPDELKIITRHMVVESYIEQKIPQQFKSTAYNTIKIPKKFVLEKMVTNGLNIDVDNIGNDMRNMSSIYGLPEEKPIHFKIFFDIRSELKSAIMDIDNNSNNGSLWGDVKNLLSVAFARKAYMQAWIEDIDEGLEQWVLYNEKAGQHMLEPNGLSKAKDDLTEWSSNNLLKMLGAPDIASDIIKTLGDITGLVESIVPQVLKDEITELKEGLYDTLLDWAMGIKYTELKNMSENPVSYLNRSDLFPAGTIAKLDSEMANFTTATTANTQTFVPFQNTIVLAKLNLIGFTGIEELRKRAGVTETLQIPNGVDMPVEFVGNMDFGYHWNSPTLANFVLWQGYDDRQMVSKVIFNLNGTTPRMFPMFTNITPGPVQSDNVPGVGNIEVHYSNAPDEVNAMIGLYPVGNPDPNSPTSWKFISRETSGDYSVTAPFTSGKFEFRIYNTDKQLLGTSAPVEVIGLEGQAGNVDTDTSLQSGIIFSDVRTSTIKVGSKEYLYAKYHNVIDKPNIFIGLYNINSTGVGNPESVKKSIGNTEDDYYLVSPPRTPGDYEFRIFDINNNLLVKSSSMKVLADGNNQIPPASTSTELSKTARKLSAVAGDKMVNLKWDPIANAAGLDGFYIYRSTSPDGSNVSPANDFPVAGTSYVDKNVENGKTYFYMIKAVFSEKTGGKSYGEASNIVAASPLQQKGLIELVIGNPMMKVNNISKEIDPGKSTAPVTISGRTFVPIRAIIEAMGGSLTWVGSEQKIVIVLNDKTIELWLNSKTAKINGISKETDVAPYSSKTGRTMVPLRFVIENLSCNVLWDGPSSSITISYDTSAVGGQPAIVPTTPIPDPAGNIPTNFEHPEWLGSWNTDYGLMDFQIIDNKIRADYGEGEYINDKFYQFYIEGTVETQDGVSMLIGSWIEDKPRGTIKFTLSADGKSFDGKWWRLGENEEAAGDWDGTR